MSEPKVFSACVACSVSECLVSVTAGEHVACGVWYGRGFRARTRQAGAWLARGWRGVQQCSLSWKCPAADADADAAAASHAMPCVLPATSA